MTAALPVASLPATLSATAQVVPQLSSQLPWQVLLASATGVGTAAALAAAFSSMLLYGAASVAQAAAARRTSGPRVVVHPLYLLGSAADVLAWAASLLALTALPLVVVQPIVAGGVAVAVLLAVPLLRVHLVRRDGLGVALTTAGLVLVAAAAGDPGTAVAPSWFTSGCLTLLLTCAVAAAAGYRGGPGWVMALVSGWAFAGAALAGRVVAPTADLGSWDGVLHLAGSVLAWSVLAFGLLGNVTFARALERGGLGVATALMFAVEAVVPAVVGAAVLGDGVRAGWWGAALAGLGAAVAGCVVLATSPTQRVIGGPRTP